MKHVNTSFFKFRSGSHPHTAQLTGSSAGVALFFAISLLALFSVLGSSYMRFMSLELAESEIRVRDIQARYYATAGINSVAGHIYADLSAGELPDSSYTFFYAVYGQGREEDEYLLKPLSTYTAEAQVMVEGIGREAWDRKFMNNVRWPGAGRAFRLVCSAKIQQAIPGRIVTIAHHAVNVVLVAQKEDISFLSWNTIRNYDSLQL